MEQIEHIDKDVLLEGPFDTDLAENQVGLKLDLACGTSLRTGYHGVDNVSLEEIIKGAEGYEGEEKFQPTAENYTQHDLLDFPWPFEDNSVAATFSNHFVEHIPHSQPLSSIIPKLESATDFESFRKDLLDSLWGDDGWWEFFGELYRVMEDGGICEFIHPFSRSDRAFWDPTHTRFIHYQTWFYLDKKWRIEKGVDHYATEVNFEVQGIQTIHEPTLLEGRSAEVIEFARQFYFNPTDDLFVVLKANK